MAHIRQGENIADFVGMSAEDRAELEELTAQVDAEERAKQGASAEEAQDEREDDEAQRAAAKALGIVMPESYANVRIGVFKKPTKVRMTAKNAHEAYFKQLRQLRLPVGQNVYGFQFQGIKQFQKWSNAVQAFKKERPTWRIRIHTIGVAKNAETNKDETVWQLSRDTDREV